MIREEKLKSRTKSPPSQTRSVMSPSISSYAFDPLFSIAPRPVMNLAGHSIGNVASILYLPSFVSKSESDAIVSLVQSVPASHPRWVNLSGRSLQCWGGQPPHPSRSIGGNTSQTEFESLPPWLDSLCDILTSAGIFPPHGRPNHVLINRYRQGYIF